jgi:hypothetical protein
MLHPAKVVCVQVCLVRLQQRNKPARTQHAIIVLCVVAGLVLNSIVMTQILVYGNKGIAAKTVKGTAADKKAA